jgi:hypothetical protein
LREDVEIKHFGIAIERATWPMRRREARERERQRSPLILHEEEEEWV